MKALVKRQDEKKTKNDWDLSEFDEADFLDSDAEIQGYLQSCIEAAPNDSELIAYALGVVARAKGMSKVAKASGLSREGLYKALNKGANPEFATILKVLNSLGLRMQVVPVTKSGAVY